MKVVLDYSKQSLETIALCEEGIRSLNATYKEKFDNLNKYPYPDDYYYKESQKLREVYLYDLCYYTSILAKIDMLTPIKSITIKMKPDYN